VKLWFLRGKKKELGESDTRARFMRLAILNTLVFKTDPLLSVSIQEKSSRIGFFVRVIGFTGSSFRAKKESRQMD
jgi:hypothetical protein